jgi:hypothetical protein
MHLAKDLRYAFRQLGRSPGFVITTVPARRAASIEPMQALRSE